MSLPNTSELDDDQIEALIRKLSAIKGSAPELIAALEAEASSRLSSKQGGSSSRRRGGSGGVSRHRSGERPAPRGSAPARRSSRDRAAAAAEYNADPYGDHDPEEEEEDDDYEEEEDDDETESDEDEFDEDGPCVGYGYSDEVSVISEMTTPTVVSNLHVNEEERYHEIQHGYGAAAAMTRNASKKPDLLSQVNRVNAARQKANKVAALNEQRRKAYTSGLSAMAKISETAEVTTAIKPKSTSKSSSKKAMTRSKSADGAMPNPPPPSSRKAPSRGVRRESPSRNEREKTSTMRKKSSGGGKKNSSKRDLQNSQSSGSNNMFADVWNKSLTTDGFHTSATDGGTDDNGFPFSFGADDNNNFFKSSSDVGGTDPFDPFATGDGGDPFANAVDFGDSSGSARIKSSSNRSGGAKSSSGNRPRRTSAAARIKTSR